MLNNQITTTTDTTKSIIIDCFSIV